MAARDYAREYRNYHSKPEQRKNRSSRNLARILMRKKLGVKANTIKAINIFFIYPLFFIVT